MLFCLLFLTLLFLFKLVNDGYVPEFGARPMRRVVDLDMGDVIAKELVANRLLPGDKAVMSVENDQYVIKKNELN
jgi:ATP-dependent Clp protease ATP-binding subunit ClpA